MAAGKMPGHPGFAVQALLFLAIAVHCNDDFDEARSILNQAIEIALHIGMQSRTYSAAFGEGSRVLEESWRRTWWGLYVTDGVFAGIRHRPTFSLWTVETDVELPCEESHYEAGEIPPPQTLQDYDSREFSADDTAFSSFTYLIDLGSIIGAVLAVGTDPGEPFDSSVVSADANLINWAMYHPKSKRDLIGEDGKLDEVLFQAHALFNTRPLYDIHTTKALEAAQAGLGLFTLPGPFIMHTPLVLCGLTLSMLAQISACTYVLSGMEYSKARDRVRLGLGVVKAFAEVWPLGGKAVNEVRTIATAVLSTQTVSPSSFRDVQCPRPATLDVPSDSPDRSGEGLDLDDPDLLRLSWDSAMAACLEESLPEYK
ncbi:MAG: hypothetical protein M1817_004771 [Caeruleum heppii]|nr:MAG: hypothetical protein M1817_004771 [Caeruleum heppii]